eukprot:6181638-Pleurochrysis_carterae.AAC.5
MRLAKAHASVIARVLSCVYTSLRMISEGDGTRVRLLSSLAKPSMRTSGGWMVWKADDLERDWQLLFAKRLNAPGAAPPPASVLARCRPSSVGTWSSARRTGRPWQRRARRTR